MLWKNVAYRLQATGRNCEGARREQLTFTLLKAAVEAKTPPVTHTTR